MSKLYKILTATFLLTTIYATVRYHIFGPILWKDFFIFTLNKILIFSAIILLFFLNRKSLSQSNKEILKKLIYILIALHIILSTFILKPYYLKVFFIPDFGLSLWGNLSLLFGTSAAILYFFKDQTGLSLRIRKKIFIVFVMLHLITMGWQGWIKPDAWHGGLVPITALSFLILTAIFMQKD